MWINEHNFNKWIELVQGILLSTAIPVNYCGTQQVAMQPSREFAYMCKM